MMCYLAFVWKNNSLPLLWPVNADELTEPLICMVSWALGKGFSLFVQGKEIESDRIH